jgi:parallel beta-helix repeat protein
VSLANFNDQEGVRLTDGQIDGFGNYCASIGFAGYAADLTVSNCFAGIGVGRGAVAERINSYNNKYGIDLTAEAILRDSTAVDNILNGVQVNVIDRRVIIENNQIIGNGSSGIFAKGPILADNNFISTNSIGIYVSDDAAGSKIEGNVIHDNENTGLYVQDLSGVAGIALSGNALSRNGPSDTSPQISGDNASRVVEISANMCNDNTVCD